MASPRYLIAAKLGECQPGSPAPASKTFRPAGEMETLFVFLPGLPAMSSRCQLLWRAGMGTHWGQSKPWDTFIILLRLQGMAQH